MRLVLFAAPGSLISTVLCEAAVRAARARGDVEVVAVVDAGRKAARRASAARALPAALARRLFDPAHPVVLHHPVVERVPTLVRRLRVPIVVPPSRDVNDADFVATLADGLRADAGLNLFGTQIFADKLLAAFECGVVNYHNGLLPAYRGLRATAWSVYRGEATTGFTFHRMVREIDAGPILAQHAIPVRPGASMRQLEWEKARRAAALVPAVLRGLVEEDPGAPQQGEAAYFGRLERRAITHVAEPGELTLRELELRLHAFGALLIRFSGKTHMVTRLRRVDPRGPRRPHLSFVSADGIAVEADRLGFLPPALHRIATALRR